MTTITLNLEIPRSWNELTDKQLRFVYHLMAENYTSDVIKTFCLMEWGQLSVLYHEDDGHIIVKHCKDLYKLRVQQIMDMVSMMGWLDELPAFPCQLKPIGSNVPCSVDFQLVPFEQFLYCDNLYQGYLHTQNENLIMEMAKVLYDDEKIKCSQAEKISIFYWWASLKQYFSKRFSHFLQPVNNEKVDVLIGGPPCQAFLQESMDAQIRALTKGDITKEDVIRKADTWRALTELDAQAKEYEELKKTYSK